MRFQPAKVILLFALAFPGSVDAATHVTFQKRTVYAFPQEQVYIGNKFPGARISACRRLDEGKYEIRILPENRPINFSPWYAFEIWSDQPRDVRVTLSYSDGFHRYKPKVSTDGKHWKRLDPTQITMGPFRSLADLRLRIGRERLRVAGQEMIGNQQFHAWLGALSKKPFVARENVGKSLGGRPIDALTVGNPTGTNAVVIISRQHPPESTGTLGLFAFVDALVGESDLARKFRERFTTLIVPCLNPDGVHEGHWRHNLNGVDLNRDWKHFVQPETRMIRDRILKMLRKTRSRVFLFIDFHSTHRDVFYTGTEDEKTFPPRFIPQWLSSLQKRFPDYHVNIVANKTTLAVSKAWALEALGCPAVTYEFGDHTDRELISRIADGAAQEAMQLLLDAPALINDENSGE